MIPTIVSQLITLAYNMADTWFIGQTDDPYMVAASSLVLNHFFGMTGIIWTQMTADIINVGVSYLVYAGVLAKMKGNLTTS